MLSQPILLASNVYIWKPIYTVCPAAVNRASFLVVISWFWSTDIYACFKDRGEKRAQHTFFALCWVLPAAFLSHLIRLFRWCSCQKCEFVPFLSIFGHITICFIHRLFLIFLTWFYTFGTGISKDHIFSAYHKYTFSTVNVIEI